MKSLLLIRHAKADSGVNTNERDFDRNLSIGGNRSAEKMACHLKMDGTRVDLLISSPAKRTRETAGYIIEQLDISEENIIYHEDIYEASVRLLLNAIIGLPDNCEHVAMVGHNPGLTYLTEYLTGEELGSIPTFGVVKIDFDIEEWGMISQNLGEIDYFIYPKMFGY